MIDRALALMVGQMSMAAPLSSPSSGLLEQTPSSSNNARSGPKLDRDGAESRVMLAIGALNLVDVRLKQYAGEFVITRCPGQASDSLSETGSELDAAATESALKSTTLDALLEDVLDLADKDRIPLLNKAMRAVSRIWRRSYDNMTMVNKEEEAGVSLHAAIRQWLVGSIELVEDILRSPLVRLASLWRWPVLSQTADLMDRIS